MNSEEEMQEKKKKIIIDTLKELNEELENDAFLNPNSKTQLYGGNGAMDSLALVSFIADLEDKISDEFEKDIIFILILFMKLTSILE